MSGKKKRESARHNRVYPSYWTNNPHWSDDAKLLGLFLLTGPHRRTEGIYRLPVGYMAGDLGWTEKRTRKALDELVADEFVKYDERVSVVFICKALKHQGLDNPNQITAALKALQELPRTDLTEALAEAAERFSEPFAQRLRERFPEWFRDPVPDPPAPAPTPEPPKPPSGGPELLPGLSGVTAKRADRAKRGSGRGRDVEALQAVVSAVPTSDVVEAWSAVIERAREVTDPNSVGIWLEPLRPISHGPRGWVVVAPAAFGGFVERFDSVLRHAAGCEVEVITEPRAAA